MKTFFFLFLLITTFAVQAQECSDVFVNDVVKLFNRKEKAFNKNVHRVLNDHAIDIKDIEIIHIPLMFVTKKGVKLYRNRKADKEDLFCHLNKKKMLYQNSFVFSDTTIIGRIYSCFGCTIFNDIEFENSNEVQLWRLLMFEMKKNAPDFMFRIFNLPSNIFWYVKNNQLYVLTYEHTLRESKDFINVRADEYIKQYIEDTDLVFLSHKIVVY